MYANEKWDALSPFLLLSPDLLRFVFGENWRLAVDRSWWFLELQEAAAVGWGEGQCVQEVCALRAVRGISTNSGAECGRCNDAQN